jgi:hypothetical protein
VSTRLVFLISGMLCLAPSAADARYRRLSLPELSLRADLVVAGRITEVRPTTYVFEIETIVAGTSEARSLEIVQFRNWKCARRWTTYAVGQRLLVFLAKKESSPENPRWKVLGSGCEGEMPIIDELVYVVTGPRPGWAKWTRYKNVYAGHLRAYNEHLETFSSAIRGLRTCFVLEEIDGSPYPGIGQQCDDTVLGSYSREARMHKFLADCCVDTTTPRTARSR